MRLSELNEEQASAAKPASRALLPSLSAPQHHPSASHPPPQVSREGRRERVRVRARGGRQKRERRERRGRPLRVILFCCLDTRAFSGYVDAQDSDSILYSLDTIRGFLQRALAVHKGADPCSLSH